MGDQVVAGYLRVSVARDEMSAPEIYTEEIERYCRYRDLRLGELTAVSGTGAPLTETSRVQTSTTGPLS